MATNLTTIEGTRRGDECEMWELLTTGKVQHVLETDARAIAYDLNGIGTGSLSKSVPPGYRYRVGICVCTSCARPPHRGGKLSEFHDSVVAAVRTWAAYYRQARITRDAYMLWVDLK